MEKKNDLVRRRVISSIVLGGFLAILLCAPMPIVQAQEDIEGGLVIPSGAEEEIDYDVQGLLEIYGTAILRGDAKADFILAYPGAAEDAPGSTLIIYGAAEYNSLGILSATGSLFKGLPPEVTIYGYRFRIDSGLPFAPPADIPISATLDVLNELNEVQFSIWISSEVTEVTIHLREPGNEEPERIEADLRVSPSVMNFNRWHSVVCAKILLPEGITKDDVDDDYPLMIYAGEAGVEAKYKRIFNSCRQDSSQVKIFAFFNIGTLLKGLPEDCEQMQLQVRGYLKTEQEFYGNDNIKIVQPRRKHWSYMKNWRNRRPYRRR